MSSIAGSSVASSDGARIEVSSGSPLSGRIDVPGAKNSVLKLMAASLLGDGSCTITNAPAIIDVTIMADLLQALGAEVHIESGSITITAAQVHCVEPPAGLVERMRASVNLLGPLLTRYGRVRLALPGGDDFGARPIDMHIAGLEAMGARVTLGERHLEATSAGLHGADIAFDFPSVGATENIVTAAVLATGMTVIDGAAREPEVVDLCRFLVGMGAEIEGIGGPRLTVRGTSGRPLGSVEHRVVPDRIQAATYIAAVAVSGGRLEIVDARPDDMEMFLRRCAEMGLEIEEWSDGRSDGIVVAREGRIRAVDVQTLPYPGIATDYKPLVITMLSVANGSAVVTENLYPGRFRYIDELTRLGADIRTEGHHALVRGVPNLRGCPVRAHDIRAGAAMVVAGLAAQGTTTITGVEHIDRGYDDLVGRLRSVGAHITRLGEAGSAL
jgi:UDP-N-acetylglucosamine 1-carboxyvinyltransferase